MSRFQVVLAGFLASATTGLVCSAGVLLLGMVHSFLATTDWDIAVDDVRTLVPLGAIGAAVGVLLGFVPVVVVASAWNRLQTARGTNRAIVLATGIAAALVLVEVAAVGWRFENVSAREATMWSLACAGIAAVTGFLSLRASWLSVRSRRVELPLGY